MKRTLTSILAIMLALVMVLSLAACGESSSSSGENTEETQPADKYEGFSHDIEKTKDMALESVKVIKDALVLPESFDVKAIYFCDASKLSDEELVGFKIKFSAKNNLGGVIDDAGYFCYDYSTGSYEKLYQDHYESGKTEGSIKALNKAKNILDGEHYEDDSTTIFKDTSDYYAYKEASSNYEAKYQNMAERNKVYELDVDEINSKIQ